MEWFWWLGLLASVLAVSEAGLPQQLPDLGAALNPENQHQEVLVGIQRGAPPLLDGLQLQQTHLFV